MVDRTARFCVVGLRWAGVRVASTMWSLRIHAFRAHGVQDDRGGPNRSISLYICSFSATLVYTRAITYGHHDRGICQRRQGRTEVGAGSEADPRREKELRLHDDESWQDQVARDIQEDVREPRGPWPRGREGYLEGRVDPRRCCNARVGRR